MVKAADLLHRGVSPDDDDIPDALCDSEDESSEEEERKAKVGMKRKRAAKKAKRKRAEQKTEAGTEKRRRGWKAKVVDEPPPEWKIANGECE
jgi:FtsZ-interacting cell division protein YlmF